uniref:ATP-dependent RNA helicase n=1 Tax=Cebus imitator TaxID=2715852 RepID=A0A2K5PIE4_CEBIM
MSHLPMKLPHKKIKKIKKSKHSMNLGLSEAQNGDVSQEAVENLKVFKSPQKSAVLTNREAAMQNRRRKRKMVNDAGPDTKKTPKQTENNVEEPDNDEDDSEVTSLSLGLTGSFEDTSFASLCNLVNENTLKAVKEMSFTNMTEIQHKSIRPLLEDRDLLAAAKTGSGKTLAFLIPAVELVKLKFTPRNGMRVHILSPARVLAMQILGLIMGGSDRSAETQKLANGISIIVATPGHLLDHMQNTPGFIHKNLQCLVIDETDCILDVGFEDELKQIIELLPTYRQTVLFSVTQTRKVEDLARISLQRSPLYVVDGLEQGYVVCPEKRFLLLFTFLKENQKKKVMVFLSSCMSIKYQCVLLNYIDQKQNKHTATFFQFHKGDSGTLLCTDVAARELDIPEVDWIVQYYPPDDPMECIHHVGKTARGLNGRGHALLILYPEELGFLHYLKQSKVALKIKKNYFFHKSIFNVNNLNLPQVVLSFRFKLPSFIDLNVNSNERKQKKQGGGGGFGYQKTKKVEKSKILKHISKRSSDSKQFSH